MLRGNVAVREGPAWRRRCRALGTLAIALTLAACSGTTSTPAPTAAPATQAPVTQAPATVAPATQAPTQGASTPAPATEAPATPVPATATPAAPAGTPLSGRA